MRSGTLLTTVRYDRKRAKAGRLKRGLLLAGLLFALPLGSWAQNTIPTFQNSSPYSIPTPACGNIPTDISTYLKVNDPDADIETWYEAVAPNMGGTLSVSVSETGPVDSISIGGVGVPPPIYYKPSAALSAVGGTESFTIGVDDGNGGVSTIVINVTVIPGPTLSFGTMPQACAGDSVATITFASMSNIGAASTTFGYTGGAQTWTVPTFISAVDFDLNGASGGNDNVGTSPVPGKGGNIHGHLTVTPGGVLNIYVGGKGSNGSPTGAAGGFNGGGSASFYVFGSGGAGGGASDIRIGGTTLSDRVVVAGGGGGTGEDASISMAGGDGGGLVGGIGSNNLGGFHANGGTQSTGGTGSIYPGRTPGGDGSFGLGGASSPQGISGAGGGGYYGGGGGIWNGGAGGSSFANAFLTSSVTTTAGVNTGNGSVTISYSIPGTYDITWDATAVAAGFTNVTGAAFTGAGVNVVIPTSLSSTITAATTYNGVMTVNNGTCTSEMYPINITVKPVPSVALPGNQAVCNGDTTLPIHFVNGPITATSLVNNWTNDNSSIGLASSGSGDIASFTPINTTTAPSVANITVTPVADGCSGTPQTFQIVDNPIPTLSNSITSFSICDSATFSFAPTSGTSGATFAWDRAAVAGIDAPANSGAGMISEVLDNITTGSPVVTYVITTEANGCSSSANVTVTVNPQPVLTSDPNPAAICDSTTFNYTPAGTPGATFTWTRAAVAGISNGAGFGTGSISEALHNTTTSPVAVTYVYTIDINGCTSTANVMVVVNPKPTLTSSTTIAPTCDDVMFTYTQTSSIAGTTYAWGRPSVSGIANAAGNGTGNITETLDNTTTLPVTVIYKDTLSAFGCQSVYNLTLVVNPKATLTSTLTPPSICTNTLFFYIPTTGTPGTTLEWARDHVPGIANDSARAFGNISEVLIDTFDVPVAVPYHYVLTTGACVNTQTVTVIVNPQPKLSNPTTSIAICDSQIVNFIPTSSAPGATFTWSRAYVPGITQTASAGANNPNEQLVNTTNVNVDAIYVYTITANGCTNTQNVTATVRPTPRLSSLTTRIACAGSPFTYSPLSYTPGTTFTWSRSPVGGITPTSNTGSGDISETLYSSSASDVPVIYTYQLNISGCVHNQNVTVVVTPGPTAPAISTTSPTNVCADTRYASFSAVTPPPPGVIYTWSASNATVWATGSTDQFALINFTGAGTAVITLTASQPGLTCGSSSTYTVTVGSATSTVPHVIYFAGQFIAQQANVDSYQWGYDDAGTLESHEITGQTNQNFSEPAPDPNKLYWVRTSYNGCSQKAYYTAPSGVEELAAMTGIKVYPNPAENFINVEVNAAVTGNVQVEMFNLLGQKISTVTAEDRKARLDVSALPAGCYVIDCMSDGVKVASARFIKN